MLGAWIKFVNVVHPDGVFDFVPGYTVDAERGLVIFTSTEPFGSYLAEQIGDPAIAERYVYRRTSTTRRWSRTTG